MQREVMSGGLVHGVQGGGGHTEARAAGVFGAHGSPPPPPRVDIPETGGGQEQRSGGGRRQAPTEPRGYVGDLSYRRESTTTAVLGTYLPGHGLTFLLCDELPLRNLSRKKIARQIVRMTSIQYVRCASTIFF